MQYHNNGIYLFLLTVIGQHGLQIEGLGYDNFGGRRHAVGECDLRVALLAESRDDFLFPETVGTKTDKYELAIGTHHNGFIGHGIAGLVVTVDDCRNEHIGQEFCPFRAVEFDMNRSRLRLIVQDCGYKRDCTREEC